MSDKREVLVQDWAGVKDCWQINLNGGTTVVDTREPLVSEDVGKLADALWHEVTSREPSEKHPVSLRFPIINERNGPITEVWKRIIASRNPIVYRGLISGYTTVHAGFPLKAIIRGGENPPRV